MYCKGKGEKSGIVKTNAVTHHKTHHGLKRQHDPKQPLASSFATTKKHKVISEKQKIAFHNATARWIAQSGLPISLMDSKATKTYMKTLICDTLGFTEQTAGQIQVSGHHVRKAMKESSEIMKRQIKELGPKLCRDGRVFLAMDHWYNNVGSYEDSNSYHGICLLIRKTDGTLVDYILRFSSADFKDKETISREFEETLNVSLCQIQNLVFSISCLKSFFRFFPKISNLKSVFIFRNMAYGTVTLMDI